MPIYEYRCPECGLKFEIRRSMGDSASKVKCPACGKENAQRVFSSFATGFSGGACAPNSSS